MFLEREPGRTSFDVVAERGSIAKPPLLANVLDDGRKGADGDEFVKDSRFADSVCAICDNGGDILCCKGRCLRSFHATAGTDEYCESLGYSTAQVEAFPIFLCDNCRYKQHQCFACGKLGSSDKTAGAEVFPCASVTCGHFYHPKCVAQLLFRESETKATEFQKKVAAGESFTCPIHKCTICNKRENHGDPKLQFAICRRCPTSYHRKCLPRKIVFEDSGEGVFQRAWDGLLPNNILIYCMKHKIDEALRTPIRNHIIFPKSPEKKNKIKIKLKKKISDDLPMEHPSVTSCKLNGKHSIPDGSCSLGSGRIDTKLKERTGSDHCKVSLKDMTRYSVCPVSPKPTKKKICSSFPVADSETRKRLKSLMDDVSSSLTLENVAEKLTVPSTHAYFPRHIDKSVTLETMECSVEAIKTALQKLEGGGSIDEIKKLCPPSVLKEMIKWRKNLNVYLAPFLHGLRYTTSGHHVTKLDKLKEIVDKLQWYVESGDMIVDFCCGANDFSTLMKEKLDTAGKRCSFRNYDIIQPKNDFKFERKDWMTVEPNELPDGSRLIMGLNTPFGVTAALANMFIDRALKFRPKLLILIVARETERLDKKDPHYDLIWEDCDKLSGKSYLPGSIDMDEKQMEQWNLNSPPLYLWSRPDWTAKHKVIALEKGHILGTQRVITSDDNGPPTEPTFNNRDEEIVSTPGAMELKSLNKKELESNLGSFKGTEELYGSPDMKSSSVQRNGRGSTFGVRQNREELEVGEIPDELAHTKDIPADASGNRCTFEDVVAINQSESVTSRRTTDFPAAVLPGGSSRIYIGPGGFARGPVPPSLRKSSSCGWIDD